MAAEFDDLARAVRRRFGAGARIENMFVPTLGGSNRTVLFDLVEGAARRRLASRQETLAASNSPFLPTARQFRLMQIAFRHGFPAPEPVFEYDAADEMGNGFVTVAVEGETMPRRIQREPALAAAREGMAAQLGALLAKLHAIDPAEADFLSDWPDSRDPLLAQRDRLDSYGEAHPALELGLRWLERNRPPERARRLLHGDFRMGNFIVGPEGVRAVLDWECCHLGAPHEELGWICVRSWRFGRPDLAVAGVGEREPFYRAYEAAGGGRVEPEEVRYWEIFGLLRWAVLNVMQGYGHWSGARRSAIWAACGRNAALIEYELMMTLTGKWR